MLKNTFFLVNIWLFLSMSFGIRAKTEGDQRAEKVRKADPLSRRNPPSREQSDARAAQEVPKQRWRTSYNIGKVHIRRHTPQPPPFRRSVRAKSDQDRR